METGRFDEVERLEAMTPDERFDFWRGDAFPLYSLQRLPQRMSRLHLRELCVRQSGYRHFAKGCCGFL